MASAGAQFESLKRWYIARYTAKPLPTVFLTLMFASLVFTDLVSLVFPGYLSSILGVMSQHVFMDYFWSVADSMYHPYTDLEMVYPPMAVCLYSIIGHLTMPYVTSDTGDIYFDMYNSQLPMMVFALLMALSIYLLLTALRHTARPELDSVEITLFTLVALFSFPMVIALQNGNCIIYAVFFMLMFLLNYNSENIYRRYLAYICLAIVAGLKFTPALLGLLVLRERRYKEFVTLVVMVAVIVLLPIVFTDGTIPLLINNILNLPPEIGGSVNNLSKLGYYLETYCNIPGMQTVAKIAVITIAVLTAVIFIFDRKMKMWKIAALAGCFFILGPGIGTPYLYLYLLLPVVLMFTEEKEKTAYNIVFLVLMTLPLMLFPMDLLFLKVGSTILIVLLLLKEGLMDIIGEHSGKTSAADR